MFDICKKKKNIKNKGKHNCLKVNIFDNCK